MKNIFLPFFLLITLFSTAMAQWPSSVQTIELKPNDWTAVQGNISGGEIISDLSWASRSSTACFPATQNAKFRGKHKLYSFQLPPYSEVEIKLVPKNKNANFSLYAYQIGTTNYTTPSELSSCVSCEADHKWDRPKRGKTQDHTRTVKLNAIRNPYNVVIGVTGPVDVEGEYSLQIFLKTRETITYDDKPAKIYSIKGEKGKVLTYKGNISEGKAIPLEWASTSNMACFPATRNEEFRGSHLFYTMELPKYSRLKVTVKSLDGSRINIYGISGHNGTDLPPNISRCVSCEAGYEKYVGNTDLSKSAGEQSIELTAINNPYKVLIGIAGAKGATSGSFELKVELMDR